VESIEFKRLTFMRTNEFKASIVFGFNIGSAYLDFWEQFLFLMLRAISVHFGLLNAKMPLSMIVLTFANYTFRLLFKLLNQLKVYLV